MNIENILRDSSCCITLVEKHLESALKWLLHTHSNFDQMGEVFVQGKTDQTGDDQRSGDSTDSQGNNISKYQATEGNADRWPGSVRKSQRVIIDRVPKNMEVWH